MMIFGFMFTFPQTSEFISSLCKATHVEIFQYRFTPGLTQKCSAGEEWWLVQHQASAELSQRCVEIFFILLAFGVNSNYSSQNLLFIHNFKLLRDRDTDVLRWVEVREITTPGQPFPSTLPKHLMRRPVVLQSYKRLFCPGAKNEDIRSHIYERERAVWRTDA